MRGPATGPTCPPQPSCPGQPATGWPTPYARLVFHHRVQMFTDALAEAHALQALRINRNPALKLTTPGGRVGG